MSTEKESIWIEAKLQYMNQSIVVIEYFLGLQVSILILGLLFSQYVNLFAYRAITKFSIQSSVD